ncbi:helix-turn-helix domain-containing protein [Bacillus sp. SCS-151]|uniref:helix-turn-helix domain-containing protein n=1 Tax=Nanhaiella sioensis TaxID=3115293 RepID=UPI0039788666
MRLEDKIGKSLKKHRKNMGLSQEELAHRCNLDRTYISMLERGLRKPTVQTIFSLCRELNIKPSDFIKEVEEGY